MMTSQPERIAKLETKIESLACKRDLDKLGASLTWRMILIAGTIQTFAVGLLLQVLR